jgi:alkylation response protein AidB-like acyl-CoA dehydrogenase
LYSPAALAARLEHQLGDPGDPDRPLSLPRCLELDEREAFPADASAELDALGVCHYDVPAEYGGAMRNREEPAALLRVLARRDVMLAVTYSSKALGAESVWVGGTPEQGVWVAGEVLAGARVALGVTERNHGGDLLSTEVSALADGAWYRVDGEKWLINGATRGRLMCVLARTDPAGGPAGMSLLLVDKRTLAEDQYHCLPKIRLHGLRGADVSGIRFDGARVPSTALVGRSGAGLNIVLRPGSTDSGGVMGGNSRWSMGWGVGSAGGHASVPGGAGFAGLGVLGAGGPDRQVQIGSRRSRAST